VLAIFAVAFVLWGLDLTRIACDGERSHVFNGHVAWHTLTAVCLVVYYRFQEQFFAPAAAPGEPAGGAMTSMDAMVRAALAHHPVRDPGAIRPMGARV
jgi:hypothetical protein